SVFFAKCSEVKVKVNRNKSSKVKYRYPKKRLKYSNEVFLLRYYTTLDLNHICEILSVCVCVCLCVCGCVCVCVCEGAGVGVEFWGHVAGFHLCCCRPFKAK